MKQNRLSDFGLTLFVSRDPSELLTPLKTYNRGLPLVYVVHRGPRSQYSKILLWNNVVIARMRRRDRILAYTREARWAYAQHRPSALFP